MPTNLPITCPNCAHGFSLDEVLTSQVRGEFQRDFEEATRKREGEIRQQEATLAAREEQLKKQAEDVGRQVEDTLARERQKLVAELKEQAKSDVTVELAALQEQLGAKEEKLKAFQAEQLNLLKEKAALEESRQGLELEVQRKLEAERATIKEAVLKDTQERYHWEVQQKEKTISDLNKKVEEMAQKIALGSQQSQGEVVELELETTLRALCPLDDIVPVGKGVNGADIIQVVRNRAGAACGKIIWESKNTRNWSAGWIGKVKDDQRREKAEIAIIVSSALPESIKSFDQVEGVWVTRLDCIPGLVGALRGSLQDICAAKVQSENRQEKMEVLYDYVSGIQFRQRVEAIAETFTSMQADLLKEKNFQQKVWAKREMQMTRVVSNMFGMYGDFQGLIGPSMGELTSLSIDSGEDE